MQWTHSTCQEEPVCCHGLLSIAQGLEGGGFPHVGLLLSRVKCYTPVTVLYAELPLLELVVAGGPVGEGQGVPGVVLQGRAVALQGCREVSFPVPGE